MHDRNTIIVNSGNSATTTNTILGLLGPGPMWYIIYIMLLCVCVCTVIILYVPPPSNYSNNNVLSSYLSLYKVHV